MARGDGRRGARPGAGRVAGCRPCAVAAVAAGRAVALLGTPRLGALAAVLLALGAAGGHLRLAALDAPAGRIRDGAPVALRAELVTPPRPGRFGSSAEADVSSGRLRGTRLLIRAPAWGPFPRRRCAPATELALSGRLGALAADGRERLRRSPAPPRGGRRAGARAGARHRPPARRAGGRARPACARRAERAVAAGCRRRGGAAARHGARPGRGASTRSRARTSARAGSLTCWRCRGQNVMLLAALALPLLLLAGVGTARPAGRCSRR